MISRNHVSNGARGPWQRTVPTERTGVTWMLYDWTIYRRPVFTVWPVRRIRPRRTVAPAYRTLSSAHRPYGEEAWAEPTGRKARLTAPSHKYSGLIVATGATYDTNRTQFQGRQEIGLKFVIALLPSQYFFPISELKERQNRFRPL